jgi:hypothetical protein
MLSVLDLANAAVAADKDDPEGGELTVPKVLRLLDLRTDSLNAHLANPLNHPRRGAIRPRETALSGAEPVYGPLLTLTYCAHDPFFLLDEHAEIQAFERHLASTSGLVNPFITHCIALIDEKIEPYRIAYTAADGSCGYFDKYLQNTQGGQPAEKALERWIVWSSDALVSHGRWPTPERSR